LRNAPFEMATDRKIDDLGEQLLLSASRPSSANRRIAEPEPGEEAVGRGRVLELLLGCDLRVDRGHRFVGTPVPLDSPVPDPVRGLASYV
jgi:hypothetical protein